MINTLIMVNPKPALGRVIVVLPVLVMYVVFALAAGISLVNATACDPNQRLLDVSAQRVSVEPGLLDCVVNVCPFEVATPFTVNGVLIVQRVGDHSCT